MAIASREQQPTATPPVILSRLSTQDGMSTHDGTASRGGRGGGLLGCSGVQPGEKGAEGLAERVACFVIRILRGRGPNIQHI